MIFVIFDAFWYYFWVPGASNLSGFFVNFLGKAPGSLLDAFWMPFGCSLGALGPLLPCLPCGPSCPGSRSLALHRVDGVERELIGPRLRHHLRYL